MLFANPHIFIWFFFEKADKDLLFQESPPLFK